MVRKNLATFTLRLPGEPNTRLYDYINRITKLAKNKYNVDMGPLFTIRTREVFTDSPGQRMLVDPIRGYNRLEPNEPAFEAIDRSTAMEVEQLKDKANTQLLDDMRREGKEWEDRQIEGNYEVVDGEVVPITFNVGSLPQINIQC